MQIATIVKAYHLKCRIDQTLQIGDRKVTVMPCIEAIYSGIPGSWGLYTLCADCLFCRTLGPASAFHFLSNASSAQKVTQHLLKYRLSSLQVPGWLMLAQHAQC